MAAVKKGNSPVKKIEAAAKKVSKMGVLMSKKERDDLLNGTKKTPKTKAKVKTQPAKKMTAKKKY